jgi:hypothetical protein
MGEKPSIGRIKHIEISKIGKAEKAAVQLRSYQRKRKAVVATPGMAAPLLAAERDGPTQSYQQYGHPCRFSRLDNFVFPS